MKIIGLEEHMATQEGLVAWARADPSLSEPILRWTDAADLAPALLDLDDSRIRAMDDAGLDVSVLSVTAPGLQILDPVEATALQVPTNDIIAAAVARHPDRLQGFAALATPAPAAAAAELRRAVVDLGLNGALVHARSGERSLDAPEFWDIWEAAADLRAPVYLHPRAPLSAVDTAYDRSFDDPVNELIASGAPGWPYDAGLTVLRMVIRGVFDRFPDLQVILGHWGEVVLFYLDHISRVDSFANLQRPVAEYFQTNVYVTPSGLSSHRYLRWALEVLGAQRLMYASDYPYNMETGHSVRHFLDSAPIADEDRERIAHGNWEELVSHIRR